MLERFRRQRKGDHLDGHKAQIEPGHEEPGEEVLLLPLAGAREEVCSGKSFYLSAEQLPHFRTLSEQSLKEKRPMKIDHRVSILGSQLRREQPMLEDDDVRAAVTDEPIKLVSWKDDHCFISRPLKCRRGRIGNGYHHIVAPATEPLG